MKPLKPCPDCGTDVPENFSKNTASPTGYNRRCKRCWTIRYRGRPPVERDIPEYKDRCVVLGCLNIKKVQATGLCQKHQYQYKIGVEFTVPRPKERIIASDGIVWSGNKGNALSDCFFEV